MSNWMNEAGEPYMTAAQLRLEAELDEQYAYERQFDDFYDNEPDPDMYDECEHCPDGWVDKSTGICVDCGVGIDGEPCYPDHDPIEDQWLDSYMEDRMTTMFDG